MEPPEKLTARSILQAQLLGFGDLLDQLRGRLQPGTGEGDTVDTLHGWRVEYHYGGVSILAELGEPDGKWKRANTKG